MTEVTQENHDLAWSETLASRLEKRGAENPHVIALITGGVKLTWRNQTYNTTREPMDTALYNLEKRKEAGREAILKEFEKQGIRSGKY